MIETILLILVIVASLPLLILLFGFVGMVIVWLISELFYRWIKFCKDAIQFLKDMW